MFVIDPPPGLVDKFWERFYEVQAEYAGLLQTVKRIPHLELQLDTQVDSSKLRHETSSIVDWYPHKLTSAHIPDFYKEAHQNSYLGQTFYDCNYNNITGMSDTPLIQEEIDQIQFDQYGSEVYAPTPLGEQMPYAVELVSRIGKPRRCRVIKTPPGKGIVWHSHHKGPYIQKDYCTIIVIITISTNSQCIHGVKPVGGTERVFNQHYQEGKVYLFNSGRNISFGIMARQIVSV